MKNAKRSLVLGISSAIACILQSIALVMYLNRLPDDWVGIVLYGVTAIAFSVIAAGFFIQWKKAKRKEAQEH